MHELSLPEPMLSLSMLILAKCPEHAQESPKRASSQGGAVLYRTSVPLYLS